MAEGILKAICIIAVFMASSLHSQFVPHGVCVLYDSKFILETHSAFIKLLTQSTSDGYVISSLKNKSIQLTKFGNIAFKNLVIISSLASRWDGSISVTGVLEYVDKGGNLFFITESYGSESRSIVSELGFLDAPGSIVVDHQHPFEYIKTNNNYPGVIVESAYSEKFGVMFQERQYPIKYSGKGFALDSSNPMTLCIINPSQYAYLHDPNSASLKSQLAVGTGIVLIGGVEMRNKARAVLSGSLSVFSDEFFFSPLSVPRKGSNSTMDTGNLMLASDLIDWVFQKRCVLRVTSPSHILLSSGKSLEEYVVDTLLEYSIVIEEQSFNGKWVPFYTDGLQLELIRLTTFARINFNYTGQGRYTAQFYTPDFIGTYGLHTKIMKRGYSTIDHQVKIIIRPRKHDDYARFLAGAWPYYLTSFSMMFMVFCLVLALLNQASPKSKDE